jgi:hypothetical protein
MSLPASVLVGCVMVHIAISPVLIFGLGPLPALGPAGAGWGTGDPVRRRQCRDDLVSAFPRDRPAEFP